MNHLEYMLTLKNNYYGVRHGESKANTLGVIVSYPEHGRQKDYGLTELGLQQIAHMAEKIKISNPLIISSDFSRTRESAQEFARIWGVEKITLSSKLRERNFGDFELKSHDNYASVWRYDNDDVAHRQYGVESALDAMDRVTKLIQELESEYDGRNIVLVSHGDVLQILQAAFEGHSLHEHTGFGFRNGEIRQFILGRPTKTLI